MFLSKHQFILYPHYSATLTLYYIIPLYCGPENVQEYPWISMRKLF